MARGRRGHPQISLWRILFADLLLSLAIGTLLAFAIVPMSVAQMRDAAWYWQLAAAAVGIATASAIVWLAAKSAARFDRQVLWVRETYERAKARPDMVPWERLSGLAQLIAGTLICIVIFAAAFPIVPVMAWAFRNYPWMDSWIGATLVFVPMPFFIAIMAIGFRLSRYAGFHLVRRITGSPHR